LYSRLQHAAQVVCTHGMRVDLVPSRDPQGCYEKALGNAVRAANLKLLTQVYLETHTLRQAGAMFGHYCTVQLNMRWIKLSDAD
jgi:hypothetical protein